MLVWEEIIAKYHVINAIFVRAEHHLVLAWYLKVASSLLLASIIDYF